MREKMFIDLLDSPWLRDAAAKGHWESAGAKRRFGLCVPVFSLRSGRDCGIGDFGDLERFVDWCADLGAEVVQILPINDMGLDSVPYAALSANALDPVFLALDRLPMVAEDPVLARRYCEIGAKLNEASRVDYPRVRAEKTRLLEEVYQRASGSSLMASLNDYAEANLWVNDYALYRTIKEIEEYRSWEDWGGRYASADALQRVRDEHGQRIRYHVFCQKLLKEQLRAVHDRARCRGVLIMGDIPILVSRDSADVWRNQRYFRLDTVAGAPPDMYSQDGQVWGFPTYNWDALKADDYGWWRERLRQAGRFFDLYRIDHVVGFFRIWTVAHGARTGRDGYFVPDDESVWGDHGRRLLEMMLSSSPMLPLAEDLGTIPHVCRDTLTNMGICGLKVLRWEKRWEQDRRLIDPADYPPLSLATLSTHDSETLPHWWLIDAAERQELFEALGHTGPAPRELEPDLHVQILVHVNSAGSLFSVHPLQEVLAPFRLLPGHPSSHRINVPGVVSPDNWSWRCPVTLDEMAEHGPLSELMKRLGRRDETVPLERSGLEA